MSPNRIRAVVSIVAAGALLAALTSCAPATTPTPSSTGSAPAAGATPTPTPTPTPTVAPIDTAAPAPLLNLSCADFITTAQLQKIFGSALPLVANADLSIGDIGHATQSLPASDFIRQAGGLECLWDNIGAQNYVVTGVPTPRYEVNVIFNASAAWKNYQKIGLVGSGDFYAGCDTGICQADELVGGNTWFDLLELGGNDSVAGNVFEQLIDQTKSTVAAAGTAAALPAVDPGTLPLGSQCSDFIADSAVKSALGTPAAVVSSTPISYLDDPDTYDTWDGAQDTLHDHPCVWRRAGVTVGDLAWLPAGAWGWTEAQTHPMADGPATPLAVPGLAAGDSAWIRCSAGDKACIADLVIGGNWIEASLWPVGAVSKRTAITAIATSIVTTLG